MKWMNGGFHCPIFMKSPEGWEGHHKPPSTLCSLFVATGQQPQPENPRIAAGLRALRFPFGRVCQSVYLSIYPAYPICLVLSSPAHLSYCPSTIYKPDCPIYQSAWQSSLSTSQSCLSVWSAYLSLYLSLCTCRQSRLRFYQVLFLFWL